MSEALEDMAILNPETGFPYLPKRYVWHVTDGEIAIELYTTKRVYNFWGKVFKNELLDVPRWGYKKVTVTTVINRQYLRYMTVEDIKVGSLEVYSNFRKRMKNDAIAAAQVKSIADLIGFYPPKKLP